VRLSFWRVSIVGRASRESPWISDRTIWALNSVPKDVVGEFDLDLARAIEDTLSGVDVEEPDALVQRLVTAARERVLKPYRRHVNSSRKQLPLVLQSYFTPGEWEIKAMDAARSAISGLPIRFRGACHGARKTADTR